LLRWSAQIGLQFNEHIAEPGDVVFRHACKLGFEGIVSKHLGSRYRSGRSSDWLKMKKPCGAGGEARGGRGLGQGTLAMTTFTMRMIKGNFVVTGPDVEPSNASPAARPETGAPSTIRHRRLKRSAAAVSGQRGSGPPIADARAGAKARDGDFA